jgi:hypothetical protein
MLYISLLYSQLSSKIYILFIYSAPDDNDDGDGVERSCETLIMCIITTLNNGLRNGGGIGDVLRKPSSSVRNKLSHFVSFFFYLFYSRNHFTCFELSMTCFFSLSSLLLL